MRPEKVQLEFGHPVRMLKIYRDFWKKKNLLINTYQLMDVSTGPVLLDMSKVNNKTGLIFIIISIN